jgi:hypothetical protein
MVFTSGKGLKIGPFGFSACSFGRAGISNPKGFIFRPFSYTKCPLSAVYAAFFGSFFIGDISPGS